MPKQPISISYNPDLSLFYMHISHALTAKMAKDGIDFVLTQDQIEKLDIAIETVIMDTQMNNTTNNHAAHTQPEAFCQFCDDGARDTI